jgi:hypothetical protein
MELILDTSSARLVDPDDHTGFAVVIECDGETGAAALASGGVVRRATCAANAKSRGGAILSAPRHHPSRGRSGPE